VGWWRRSVLYFECGLSIWGERYRSR